MLDLFATKAVGVLLYLEQQIKEKIERQTDGQKETKRETEKLKQKEI